MMKKRLIVIIAALGCFLLMPAGASAMHIGEGFLPLSWALIWWGVALLFLIPGMRQLAKVIKDYPERKMLLAIVGAFVFVLSALKIPSLTGSCSHPTGVGLGAIIFGPFVMVPLGFIVLLFQAVMLAHGGLTTLGANTISMAVVGPFVAYGIYWLLKKAKAPIWLSVFFGAMMGDLATYVCTAIQLAFAHPDPTGGFALSAIKFMGVFAVTQIPLAVSEGLLTVLIYKTLWKNADQFDQTTGLLRWEV